VDGVGLLRDDLQILDDLLLEAGRGCRQGEVIGRKRAQVIDAAGVRSSGENVVGSQVLQGELGARNDGILRVRHCALNGRAKLRTCGDARQKQRCYAYDPYQGQNFLAHTASKTLFAGTGSVVVVSLPTGELPEQMGYGLPAPATRARGCRLKSRAIGRLFEEGPSERATRQASQMIPPASVVHNCARRISVHFVVDELEPR